MITNSVGLNVRWMGGKSRYRTFRDPPGTILLRIIIILLSMYGLGIYVPEANGSEWSYRGSLKNPFPTVFDGFGGAMAISGDAILVGASHDEQHGTESGGVYLFDLRSRHMKKAFFPPRPLGNDLFGFSVGFVGGFVVVGAPQGRDQFQRGTGAVYLFDKSTGTLLETFHNPEPRTGAFGHALATQGHWVAVGDPMASTKDLFHTGAVFLFDSRPRTYLRSFSSPHPKAGEVDRFGHAVALLGSHVLVTAPLGGIDPVDTGVVYVFNGHTGEPLAPLYSPSKMTQEYFGWALAVQGNLVLVGAVGYGNADQQEAGIAYLFEVSSGRLLKIFHNPTPAPGDHFGEAVALIGKSALIGTPGNDFAGVDSGCVYIFDVDSGELRETIVNPAPESGAADLFGSVIVADGTGFLVGAPFGGFANHPDSGLVHVFERNRESTPGRSRQE